MPNLSTPFTQKKDAASRRRMKSQLMQEQLETQESVVSRGAKEARIMGSSTFAPEELSVRPKTVVKGRHEWHVYIDSPGGHGPRLEIVPGIEQRDDGKKATADSSDGDVTPSLHDNLDKLDR